MKRTGVVLVILFCISFVYFFHTIFFDEDKAFKEAVDLPSQINHRAYQGRDYISYVQKFRLQVIGF